MMLGFLGALTAGAVAAVLYATASARRRLPWSEQTCACGHDSYRHQGDTIDGQCDAIGCPCRRMRPE